MERPPALDRRGFLARGLWALAAWFLGPRVAAAADAGRVRGVIGAPGEEVRWQGHGAAGWFVHRCNGRERSRRRVTARPDGTALVGVPMDGGLDPGEHEFLLEAGGRQVSCGGFRVAPFRFGC